MPSRTSGLRAQGGFIFLILLAIADPHAVSATPYIPKSADQILERLPSRNDTVQKELAGLRAQLRREPGNLNLAGALARRYINLARSQADPRFLGYAQAALAPWWGQVKPPAEVLVLRATILQSTHRFPQALADLDLLLSTDRSNGQAWLTRATVLQVRGEFEQARNSCARLYGIASELVMRTCLSNVASLTGSARPSYLALKSALERSHNADPGLQLWIQTLLAEMAARLGETMASRAHFQRALALDANRHRDCTAR